MEVWHLIGHLVLAVVVGWLIFKKTKNWKLFLLCLIVSFAIDVDHLVDYWIAYGFNLRVFDFLQLSFFGKNHKVFVPLHSWELVVLLAIWSLVIKKYKWLFLTVSLALFVHILWDTISYRIYPQDYFFLYRMLRGFKMRCGW